MVTMYHKALKSLPLVIIALLVASSSPDVFAETLELHSNQSVYSPQHPLFIYGEGEPNQPLIVRLFAPDGTTANFKQLMVERNGTFNTTLMMWPEPSTEIPYGTYVIEIVSQSGLSERLNVKFATNSELVIIANFTLYLLSFLVLRDDRFCAIGCKQPHYQRLVWWTLTIYE